MASLRRSSGSQHQLNTVNVNANVSNNHISNGSKQKNLGKDKDQGGGKDVRGRGDGDVRSRGDGRIVKEDLGEGKQRRDNSNNYMNRK